MSHYTWGYRDGNLPTLTNAYKSIEQTIKTPNGLLQWMHQGTLGNIQDQRSALQPFYHDHRLKIDANYADTTIADSPLMKSDTSDSREIYFNLYPVSVTTSTKNRLKTWGRKNLTKDAFPGKLKRKTDPWAYMEVYKLQTDGFQQDWNTKGVTGDIRFRLKKQASTCLQLDPNNRDPEIPFQITIEWNDMTEDPDSEWTTISAYIVASNNYLKRTLEQTITTVTQLKTQIKTSLDTMDQHNKQLQDLPNLAAHIQNNTQTIHELDTNVQVDENMQTIAPTIQENITNIRRNTQNIAQQITKTTALATNQHKILDRIEDVEDSIEPNNLWTMLKDATDVTANAFTIANNARQIAQSTQTTMLKNIADITSTEQQVTNSIKDITDTLTNITDTVNELKRTYDNFFRDTTHHKQIDDLNTPNTHDETPTDEENTAPQTPILSEILNTIEDMKEDITNNEGGFTLTYRGRQIP